LTELRGGLAPDGARHCINPQHPQAKPDVL
jgi:hypothetical protein